MLKKANQQLQRLGAEVVKVLFMIEVKKIEFTDYIKSDFSNASLSLSFERGGKLASTKDRILDPDDNILYVNETLSLIVTLYKQSTANSGHGKYQEKVGKLTLRQLKKSKLMVSTSSSSGYKGIGSIQLPIHKLVAELSSGATKDVIYPMDAGKEVLAHVRLSARLIGDADNDDDDNMSLISDSSNHSGLATNSGHVPSSERGVHDDEEEGDNSHNNFSPDARRQPHHKIDGSSSSHSKIPETSSSGHDEVGSSSGGSPDRKLNRGRIPNQAAAGLGSGSGHIHIGLHGHGHGHGHGSSVEQRAEYLQLVSKLHDRDAEIERLHERQREQERDHRTQILALRTELGVAQGELKR